MGPTLLKKTHKIQMGRRTNRRGGKEEIDFKKKFFSLFISQIYGNRTVGIRRTKNESALCDEGYAWVPKTRDFS